MKKEKYTYESWLNGEIEYDSIHNGSFSPEDREKIHNKSKEIVIAEADKKYNNEIRRIEKGLSSAPSREKYIQSEIDIVFRILHKDIDYRNDCAWDVVADQNHKIIMKTMYYKTGRFDMDIKQIDLIRNRYRNYLGGMINYMARTPALDERAENIVLAIMYYRLDEWLKRLQTDRNFIIDKSIVTKLFKRYGDQFSGEDRESWQERWIDDDKILTPINIDDFKPENNKHLLLTILNEAFESMKSGYRIDYIEKRWGIQNYSVNISRHINQPNSKPHSERGYIKKLLSFESF